MALYDQLPVYKASYDLLLELYQVSKNMERDYKFTLGENIKNESTALIVLIYKANASFDKVELLTQAKEKVEVIRLLLRIYKDLKQLSAPQFVQVSDQLESVSKQINAWYASQNKLKN
jgi:HPt (histidine-containing phosphotransfer) domain-containing protein